MFLHPCDLLWETTEQISKPILSSHLPHHFDSSMVCRGRVKFLLPVPEMQFLFPQHLSTPQHQIFPPCRSCFHGSHLCVELIQQLEQSGLFWFPHSTGRDIWTYNGGKKRQATTFRNIKERCDFSRQHFIPKLAIFAPGTIFTDPIMLVLLYTQTTMHLEKEVFFFPCPKWAAEVQLAGCQKGVGSIWAQDSGAYLSLCSG